METQAHLWTAAVFILVICFRLNSVFNGRFVHHWGNCTGSSALMHQGRKYRQKCSMAVLPKYEKSILRDRNKIKKTSLTFSYHLERGWSVAWSFCAIPEHLQAKKSLSPLDYVAPRMLLKAIQQISFLSNPNGAKQYLQCTCNFLYSNLKSLSRKKIAIELA